MNLYKVSYFNGTQKASRFIAANTSREVEKKVPKHTGIKLMQLNIEVLQ
ncbi:hypothetical protein KORDIASMS9_02699 [Kordia sp. SMS9]|nr:hypothetical protein KORDIASMS9_02699 [Kordia sp. SMS9]